MQFPEEGSFRTSGSQKEVLLQAIQSLPGVAWKIFPF
jgi:hypothetical protein